QCTVPDCRLWPLSSVFSLQSSVFSLSALVASLTFLIVNPSDHNSASQAEVRGPTPELWPRSSLPGGSNYGTSLLRNRFVAILPSRSRESEFPRTRSRSYFFRRAEIVLRFPQSCGGRSRTTAAGSHSPLPQIPRPA